MATALDVISSADYRVAEAVISFDEARRLVAEHGGPVLAVSRGTLRRNYEAMVDSLPGVEFFYAIKSNPEPIILQTLQEAGCSADVCTLRETHWAKQAGFTPDRMIHTHPCKTERDLVACRAEGVNWFTFDSPFELPKLVRHARDAKLLLRLQARSVSSIIDLSSKFGCAVHDAAGLAAQAHAAGLSVSGLSFHVGSQCTSPEDFVPALTAAREVWDAATRIGCPLEVLDIGGGFPSPYRNAVLTIDAYCQPLQAALEDIFGDLNIRIIAEPGRGLCASAVTLATSVVGKSIRGGIPWYILDDGIYGSFSGKAFDHADFPLFVEGAESRRHTPCVVAGPTCDSGDVISRDQALPELEVNELLLVPTMGAYSSASATDFNGLNRAKSVAVD